MQQVAEIKYDNVITFIIIFILLLLLRSHGNAFGVAVGYGLDGRGVRDRAPIGSSMFTSPYRPDGLWDPSNLLYSRYRGPFREVKWPGLDTNLSPPTATEITKTWIYTSAPPYVFMNTFTFKLTVWS
jgi:hypothetical protein